MLPDQPMTASSSFSADRQVLIDVAVPRHLFRTFTYLVPAPLVGRVVVGSLVTVPFGSGRLRGVVVSVAVRPGVAFERLRPILSLASEADGHTTVPASLVGLSRLVAERYVAPWGQCLRLVVPFERPRVAVRRYGLTEAGRQALADEAFGAARGLQALLQRLGGRGSRGGVTVAALRRAVESSPAAMRANLQRLIRKGWVEERSEPSRSVSRSQRPSVRTPDAPSMAETDLLPLPPLPTEWLEPLDVALGGARPPVVLLHAPFPFRLAGVFHSCTHLIERGRTAIIVVPETARAGMVARLAQARWGDRAVLWHHGLSERDRAGATDRMRTGAVRLVVGTRSAVFAPVASVGLIAVEREDSPLLKEETEPVYHAREVASIRAAQERALLLLGSAHPSLDTVYHAARAGVVTLAKQREGGAPAVEVVDLRTCPPGTLLAAPLREGLTEALARKGRALLFLNRKGFASVLRCRDCDHVPRCPRCGVAVTLYRQASQLTCRHCGHGDPVPDVCPVCRSARLEPSGLGTERLEAEVRRLFPGAAVLRMDRGRTETDQPADVLPRLQSGLFDVVIGTQMVFHGVPLPPLSFVGVPYADAGLHLPDYRAAERTYQMLMDATAMALPRGQGGRVVLQTLLPTHHVITAVAEGNDQLFYEHELALRRALAYPPFTHLIRLCASGKDRVAVEKAAVEWGRLLTEAAAGQRGGTEEISILGPVPAPLAVLRGRYRYQLLVKAVTFEVARYAVKTTVLELESRRGRRDLKYEVDVDPMEML